MNANNINKICSQSKKHKDKIDKLFDIAGYTDEYKEIMSVNKKDYENKMENERNIINLGSEKIQVLEKQKNELRAMYEKKGKSKTEINKSILSFVQGIKKINNYVKSSKIVLEQLEYKYPKFLYLDNLEFAYKEYITIKKEHGDLREKSKKSISANQKYSAKLGKISNDLKIIEQLYISSFWHDKNNASTFKVREVVNLFGKKGIALFKFIDAGKFNTIYYNIDKEIELIIDEQFTAPKRDLSIRNQDEWIKLYDVEYNEYRKKVDAFVSPIRKQKFLKSELGKYLI